MKSASGNQTTSETIFEAFLSRHKIPFEPVPVAEGSRRPDYLVTCGKAKIAFEVKEISEDDQFRTEPFAVSSCIVGDHVRSKIEQARKQVQWGKYHGLPSVLLIYNLLDPTLQLFGTERSDFLSAMYGEHTVSVSRTTGQIGESFYGRRNLLAKDKNTSFSALGHLLTRNGDTKVTLFENVFAQYPISYEQLPACFDVVRVEMTT